VHQGGDEEWLTTVDDRRETVSLIGSNKVEETAVYGADKRKIGTVQRVMIDKISGKIAYAVVRSADFWVWRGVLSNALVQAGLRHPVGAGIALT
jgi:hypothetical protein